MRQKIARLLQRGRRTMVRENRIYIVPTVQGHLFLSMVVVMILTAATYNNNLIFILAFFLFAVFVVTMLQTHYNLKGVRLDFLSADETFAGDLVTLRWQLRQSRRGHKCDLSVRSLSRSWPSRHAQPYMLSVDELSKVIHSEILAQQRGVHALPEFVLETRYPLGIFRAWKVFRPQGQFVVYPRREGVHPPPRQWLTEGAEMAGVSPGAEGDFGELRKYREGESYHQIAWKQYARSHQLFLKIHWGAKPQHFSLRVVKEQPIEQELQQLSAWIQQALNEGATFELKAEDWRIESGSGIEHARRCWRQLAHVRSAE